jgi:hypothetical protein
MEEQIKETVKKLNLFSFVFLVLFIGSCILFNYDILPTGIWAGNANADYLSETVVVLLSLLVVPFSLRLFDLKLAKTDGMDVEKAIKSYFVWAMVRIALLYMTTLLNVAVYFLTQETKMFFCALMVFAITLYCNPGEKRMRRELKIEK